MREKIYLSYDLAEEGGDLSCLVLFKKKKGVFTMIGKTYNKKIINFITRVIGTPY